MKREEVVRWLEDRREYAMRVAKDKTGSDRQGWIEDGDYLGAAIQLIKVRRAPFSSL